MSYVTAAPNQNEAPSTPLPAAVPPPLPPLMMSSQENIQKYLRSSEPQYITAESVRQNKLLTSNKQQKRSENLDNRMPSGKGKFVKDGRSWRGFDEFGQQHQLSEMGSNLSSHFEAISLQCTY